MPHPSPSEAAPSLIRRLGRAGGDPTFLIGTALLLAVGAAFLWPTPGVPPGFHRDEASIALNAWTLAGEGVDQDGRRLPLFFLSYGGYLSPVWPYALAGVFSIATPSPDLVRLAGGAAVLLGLLALGLLIWRRTGHRGAAVATVVVGAATPWLYELGRTGLEMTVMPMAIAVLLLAVDAASRGGRRRLLLHASLVALSLAAVTYCYAGGRGLAPLAAAALVVLGRRRWLFVASTWALYAVTLVPLALHWDVVRARYDQTSFVDEDMSPLRVVATFLWNYLQDSDLPKLLVAGDDRGYIHTWGAGQLLLGVVALAAVGLWAGARERDRFWAWVALLLVLAPVPAALTTDRLHAERLVPVAVLLLALAGRGLAEVPALVRRGRRLRLVCGVVALVTLAQFGWFVQNLAGHAGERTLLFDAAVPTLLREAFARPGPVYIDFDERYGQTHARWYAATHELPQSEVVILADGGVPAAGATIFGRLQECDFGCLRIAEGDGYWVAVAESPG